MRKKRITPSKQRSPGEGDTPVDMGSDTDERGVYGVYTLSQNRQISTGQMQYFDTPYFGALVYVSNITVN